MILVNSNQFELLILIFGRLNVAALIASCSPFIRIGVLPSGRIIRRHPTTALLWSRMDISVAIRMAGYATSTTKILQTLRNHIFGSSRVQCYNSTDRGELSIVTVRHCLRTPSNMESDNILCCFIHGSCFIERGRTKSGGSNE
jgi:hypothetical protein